MLKKGSLLVFASQFVAVAVHSLAKLLEANAIDPQQILQVRMFITLGINSLLLKSRFPEELPLGKRGNVGRLLVLRTMGGICGAVGFYYSLEYLPLADATTLNLLAPLGASFVTAKSISLVQVGCVAICFVGVGLIAKPSFVLAMIHDYGVSDQETSQPQLGFAFAMIGALGGVCAYSAVAKIGSRSHPLVITNCFAAGILLVSSICFAVVPGVTFNFNLGLLPWCILGLIGLSGALMEYLLTAGLSAEEDGFAVYMIYFQVVLALVVDVLAWHTIPDVASCSGALLVVLALYVSQSAPQRERALPDVEMASRS
ncbi:hypothetical protein BKA61DRAFT_498815 [Leptodontidium sp. MPI-SDFR-AT-0119]|nr:hypothetical protein BKA61DRAFT_498815 [Leptodontidium sp. MPI-SDFR-AT-0119]